MLRVTGGAVDIGSARFEEGFGYRATAQPPPGYQFDFCTFTLFK